MSSIILTENELRKLLFNSFSNVKKKQIQENKNYIKLTTHKKLFLEQDGPTQTIEVSDNPNQSAQADFKEYINRIKQEIKLAPQTTADISAQVGLFANQIQPGMDPEMQKERLLALIADIHQRKSGLGLLPSFDPNQSVFDHFLKSYRSKDMIKDHQSAVFIAEHLLRDKGNTSDITKKPGAMVELTQLIFLGYRFLSWLAEWKYGLSAIGTIDDMLTVFVSLPNRIQYIFRLNEQIKITSDGLENGVQQSIPLAQIKTGDGQTVTTETLSLGSKELQMMLDERWWQVFFSTLDAISIIALARQSGAVISMIARAAHFVFTKGRRFKALLKKLPLITVNGHTYTYGKTSEAQGAAKKLDQTQHNKNPLSSEEQAYKDTGLDSKQHEQVETAGVLRIMTKFDDLFRAAAKEQLSDTAEAAAKIDFFLDTLPVGSLHKYDKNTTWDKIIDIIIPLFESTNQAKCSQKSMYDYFTFAKELLEKDEITIATDAATGITTITIKDTPSQIILKLNTIADHTSLANLSDEQITALNTVRKKLMDGFNNSRPNAIEFYGSKGKNNAPLSGKPDAEGPKAKYYGDTPLDQLEFALDEKLYALLKDVLTNPSSAANKISDFSAELNKVTYNDLWQANPNLKADYENLVKKAFNVGGEKGKNVIFDFLYKKVKDKFLLKTKGLKKVVYAAKGTTYTSEKAREGLETAATQLNTQNNGSAISDLLKKDKELIVQLSRLTSGAIDLSQIDQGVILALLRAIKLKIQNIIGIIRYIQNYKTLNKADVLNMLLEPDALDANEDLFKQIVKKLKIDTDSLFSFLDNKFLEDVPVVIIKKLEALWKDIQGSINLTKDAYTGLNVDIIANFTKTLDELVTMSTEQLLDIQKALLKFEDVLRGAENLGLDETAKTNLNQVKNAMNVILDVINNLLFSAAHGPMGPAGFDILVDLSQKTVGKTEAILPNVKSGSDSFFKSDTALAAKRINFFTRMFNSIKAFGSIFASGWLDNFMRAFIEFFGNFPGIVFKWKQKVGVIKSKWVAAMSGEYESIKDALDATEDFWADFSKIKEAKGFGDKVYFFLGGTFIKICKVFKYIVSLPIKNPTISAFMINLFYLYKFGSFQTEAMLINYSALLLCKFLGSLFTGAKFHFLISLITAGGENSFKRMVLETITDTRNSVISILKIWNKKNKILQKDAIELKELDQQRKEIKDGNQYIKALWLSIGADGSINISDDNILNSVKNNLSDLAPDIVKKLLPNADAKAEFGEMYNYSFTDGDADQNPLFTLTFKNIPKNQFANQNHFDSFIKILTSNVSGNSYNDDPENQKQQILANRTLLKNCLSTKGIQALKQGFNNFSRKLKIGNADQNNQAQKLSDVTKAKLFYFYLQSKFRSTPLFESHLLKGEVLLRKNDKDLVAAIEATGNVYNTIPQDPVKKEVIEAINTAVTYFCTSVDIDSSNFTRYDKIFIAIFIYKNLLKRYKLLQFKKDLGLTNINIKSTKGIQNGQKEDLNNGFLDHDAMLTGGIYNVKFDQNDDGIILTNMNNTKRYMPQERNVVFSKKSPNTDRDQAESIKLELPFLASTSSDDSTMSSFNQEIYTAILNKQDITYVPLLNEVDAALSLVESYVLEPLTRLYSCSEQNHYDINYIQGIDTITIQESSNRKTLKFNQKILLEQGGDPPSVFGTESISDTDILNYKKQKEDRQKRREDAAAKRYFGIFGGGDGDELGDYNRDYARDEEIESLIQSKDRVRNTLYTSLYDIDEQSTKIFNTAESKTGFNNYLKKRQANNNERFDREYQKDEENSLFKNVNSTYINDNFENIKKLHNYRLKDLIDNPKLVDIMSNNIDVLYNDSKRQATADVFNSETEETLNLLGMPINFNLFSKIKIDNQQEFFALFKNYLQNFKKISDAPEILDQLPEHQKYYKDNILKIMKDIEKSQIYSDENGLLNDSTIASVNQLLPGTKINKALNLSLNDKYKILNTNATRLSYFMQLNPTGVDSEEQKVQRQQLLKRHNHAMFDYLALINNRVITMINNDASIILNNLDNFRIVPESINVPINQIAWQTLPNNEINNIRNDDGTVTVQFKGNMNNFKQISDKGVSYYYETIFTLLRKGVNQEIIDKDVITQKYHEIHRAIFEQEDSDYNSLTLLSDKDKIIGFYHDPVAIDNALSKYKIPAVVANFYKKHFLINKFIMLTNYNLDNIAEKSQNPYIKNLCYIYELDITPLYFNQYKYQNAQLTRSQTAMSYDNVQTFENSQFVGIPFLNADCFTKNQFKSPDIKIVNPMTDNIDTFSFSYDFYTLNLGFKSNVYNTQAKNMKDLKNGLSLGDLITKFANNLVKK